MPAGKPTLSSLWRLFKIVRQTQPDVLMGWMYHGCLVATLAKCMRIKRVPMIWNIRQSLYDLKLEKRGSALVIRALAKLSWLPQRITYNSQLSARQHEAIGFRSSKTQLIPNGFDLAKWQPGKSPCPRTHRPLRPQCPDEGLPHLHRSCETHRGKAP